VKIISSQIFCNIALLAVTLQISGCADTIRDDSADDIAEQVKQVSTPDKQGLSWFAPELHISHYRTLFYGYDTLDYRLTAPVFSENKTNDSFRLLIEANYGGDQRHYDFARLADESTRGINLQQHRTERCQIFNSMISSCLYRDRFSLTLSRSELEKERVLGIQLLLASSKQQYERLDLPSNYIQGFLKAIENSPDNNDQKH
jgi:hypothetical protein